MATQKKNQTLSSDPVNHPEHYNVGRIEVIDFIEDQGLNFHLGNAVKYICRPRKYIHNDVEFSVKKRIEDLQKAVWYIQRQIQNHSKGLTNGPR